MKAAIYLRQSLDKSNEGLGIERQRAECEDYCARKGYEAAQVISENNVSATYGKRTGFASLLELIESGAVQVVVTYRLDRLLRKLTELEALIELSERTGVVLDTVQGEIDISNAQGRLIGRILASVARSEAEVKGERHRLANAQRAARGLPQGSRRPFGYERDLVTINQEEAAVLREMAARVLKGHGFNEVAKWANEQGYTTTTGRPWLGVTVTNMLKKPRYGGIRSHNGTEYRAAWEPVFDSTTWERLKLELRVREGRNVPKARKYLLTGLTVCGKCGATMNGSTKTDRPGRPKRRIYQCVGCRGVARNADALDQFIRDCVLYRLDSPELAKLLEPRDDGELNELLNERASHKARLDALVDDYATGLLDREQFARAKTAAEKAIAGLDSRIASVTPGGICIPAHELRKSWDDNPTNWRRSLIALLVSRVVVLPGSAKPFYHLDSGQVVRFAPDLIEIDWLA